MGNEHGFGSELLSEAWTGGKVFAKRLKYFIPALLAAGFGLFMAMDPEIWEAGSPANYEYFEGMIIVVAICAIVFLFFMILAFALVKRSKIVIYEEGFAYTRGRRTKSMAYSQMDSTFRESGVVGGGFIIGGLIGMLPIFQVHKFTAVSNKGAKPIVMRHRRTPGYNFATRELEQAFARYLLRGISLATLPTTNISFGDQLQLRNGELVHTVKKWRKTTETVIPFSDITSISDTEPVTIEGGLNAKGKRETLVNLGDTGRNIEVLRQIYKMVK